MVIQTPRLCNDIAFLPPQKDEPNAILCSPILSSEDDIQDYERDMAALKQAEQEAEIWAADAEAAKVFLGSDAIQDYQVAGDIAIGARTIVPEGVTLEKSAIVGGGKEKYIDTIASSDSNAFSKEQLEKLGLGDEKSLEKLKKALEKAAGGQEWKLTIVETPQGRKEYRGIIGSDEKDETEKVAKDGQDGGEKAAGGGDEGSEEEYYKEEL